MDGLDRLAARSLQDSGAIDDGVDARKARNPRLDGRVAIEIYDDRWLRTKGRRLLRIANGSDDFMAADRERRMELTPDESRCAQEKDAHGQGGGGAPAGRLYRL